MVVEAPPVRAIHEAVQKRRLAGISRADDHKLEKIIKAVILPTWGAWASIIELQVVLVLVNLSPAFPSPESSPRLGQLLGLERVSVRLGQRLQARMCHERTVVGVPKEQLVPDGPSRRELCPAAADWRRTERERSGAQPRQDVHEHFIWQLPERAFKVTTASRSPTSRINSILPIEQGRLRLALHQRPGAADTPAAEGAPATPPGRRELLDAIKRLRRLLIVLVTLHRRAPTKRCCLSEEPR